MSKIDLAVKLADEIGVSVEKASRFVDDVGATTARGVLDEAASAGSKTISKWAKPATIGGTAIGGGALVWRQQDVAKARALAERQATYQETVADLMNSDLPPELKRKLLADAGQAATSDGGNGDGGEGATSMLPDNPAALIILVIVMVFVLKFALDGGD